MTGKERIPMRNILAITLALLLVSGAVCAAAESAESTEEAAGYKSRSQECALYWSSEETSSLHAWYGGIKKSLDQRRNHQRN